MNWSDRAESPAWPHRPRNVAGIGPMQGPFVLACGLAAAAAVVADPLLSGFVPARWWALAGMENVPLKATPVLLIASVALALLVRSRPGYLTILIATLQMNGLRAGPLDMVDLALLVGVGALTAQLFSKPDTDLRLGIPGHMALLLVLFGLPHLIVQDSVARYGIGMFGLIRSLLLTIVVLNLVRTEADLKRTIRIVVWVAFFSALVGLVQFAASTFWGIHVTLIDPPDTAFKPTPIGVVMRSSGLCITAQHQSGFLAMALPFALWRSSDRWKALDLFVVLVIGLGIVVTWNMGAILITAAASFGFLLLRWPSHLIHVTLAALLACTALYYLDGFTIIYDTVFNAGVAKGASQRATLLSIGLDKLDRNLFVGTGPQGFAGFSGNFWGRPVHNTLVQIATELGVVASLCFLAGILTLLTALALTAAELRKSGFKPTLLCASLMVATLFGISFSEPMMDHSNTWFFLALAQAALFAGRRAIADGQSMETSVRDRDEQEEAKRPGRKHGRHGQA